LKNFLPFRHEDDKNILNRINPVIRFLLPFILVIPFLILNNIFFTLTIILFNTLSCIVFQLKLIKILFKLKVLIPFLLLLTIFIPFYVGETLIYQFQVGFTINIYYEGLILAISIFLRVFGSAFIFLSFFSSLTYSEFIETLTKIRIIPAFFVGSIVIMLHYIPILASSNRKILDAQELRGKNLTNYWLKLQTHAFIMGKNLIHNLQRSEKLYESLKMRGFTGRITIATKKFNFVDFSILFLFIFIIISFIFIIDLELIYREVFKLFLP
jgi:cobalt/nickel transport system permease protein